MRSLFLFCFIFHVTAFAPLPTFAEELPYQFSKSEAFVTKQLQELRKLSKIQESTFSKSNINRVKTILKKYGWPTFKSSGVEGINLAGNLIRKCDKDPSFQEQIIELVADRIDEDINAEGFVRWNDEIQSKIKGNQEYSSLLKVVDKKVVLASPQASPSTLLFIRDFYGLPTAEENIAKVQKHIDSGLSIEQANPVPPLGKEFYGYALSDIRMQLGRMLAKDQKLRNEITASPNFSNEQKEKELEQIDQLNLVGLRKIIDTYGFPTPNQIGRDGVSTLFLLVQHADSDPAFQRKILSMMEPLVQTREVPKYQFAYLTDRVLRNEGKNQVYGTQTHVVDNKIVLFPVDDPSNLNERRKKMSLSNIERYVERLQKDLDEANKSTK